MVLFGDRSEENRNKDHETVELIEPPESSKSRHGGVLALTVHFFWMKHRRHSFRVCFSTGSGSSPHATVDPAARGRYSCPPPSAAPSSQPPAGRWGCTRFAGRAPAGRCISRRSGRSSPACSSAGESLSHRRQ